MRRSLQAVGVLAWRNLWRNHRRTLVMLVAIGIGVWAMIFMSSLMRGMTDDMMRNGLNSLPGEVQIHQANYRADPSVVNSMTPPTGELQRQLSRPPVVAWSTRVRVPAVVASEHDNRGVTLLGVDPEQERALGSLPGEILEGRFLDSEHDRGLVIGRKLAARLETGLGKRVVLMSQDPDNNIADRGVRVIGIYRARLQGAEDQFVYAGRAAVQDMLGIGQRVSEIAVTGNDYRSVASWYPRLAVAAGDNLEVLPWTELDSFMAAYLPVQDGFSLIFMVVVFAVLSFGLVNTLAMAVFERVREIGLMQALGMQPRLILGQLLLESLYLLCLGLLLGNLLALATIIPLSTGIDISAVAQGMEIMGMGTVLYPVLSPVDMAMSTAVVIVLGLLASLIPAWRAARLDPIRALNTV